MSSPDGRPIVMPRGPGHDECLRQAAEVMEILGRGGYRAPSGKVVDLSGAIRAAVAGTVEHRPDEALPPAPSPSRTTRIDVVDATSLATARRIAAAGAVPMVLNFASAHSPGGGFLRGARAQEESLARSSALYACIEGRAMYAHHRRQADALYTSWMIWSPDVPVFRDEETGQLLEEPYACAFLTAAAPNAREVLECSTSSRLGEVERVMRERVARSLAIARAHRHTHLVLGAWGCGVFGNDPAVVADAYQRELEGPFAGAFEEIVFAVLDDSADRQTIGPFAERYVGA